MRFWFLNAKEVKTAEPYEEQLRDLEWENEIIKSQITAFNYFNAKYPSYKLLSVDVLDNICKEFDAVYYPVDKFTGSVPCEALQELEAFEVDEADYCYIYEKCGRNRLEHDQSYFLNLKGYNDVINDRPHDNPYIMESYDAVEMRLEKLSLEIVVSKVDVVVLKPVSHGGYKYYLVVTMWKL